MKIFSDKITFVKNIRGCVGIDTIIGCVGGKQHNNKGCYGSCYAVRGLKRCGVDFNKPVPRYFKSFFHKINIIRKINKDELNFFRVGINGDPSIDWNHTINILKNIVRYNEFSLFPKVNKKIVIVTKHWDILTNEQLEILSKMDVCFNTSVSALDKKHLLLDRLEQYKRIKKYCKSVLRIVSCDFNLKNEVGKKLGEIQEWLFKNENVLDTVLRVLQNNKYALDGIINIEKRKFLNKDCYASVYNKNTYFGNCEKCPEMCGINL